MSTEEAEILNGAAPGEEEARGNEGEPAGEDGVASAALPEETPAAAEILHGLSAESRDEDGIELVVTDVVTAKATTSRIDENEELSTRSSLPSPIQNMALEYSKSGRRSSIRTATPKPGYLAAVVRSPAYQMDDGSSASPVLTSFNRTASIGNATAAQLHASTPSSPIKFTLGRVFDDTNKFDDLPLLDAPNSWRIAGIAVWGGHVVNGIRITYERGGVLRSSRELVGYDDPPHEWEQIELRPGEEIVKIEAVISFRIEKLTFRTSQSRHGTFGRGTDGEVHELSVPSEHRLVAFHGGVGGSLHTFGFWTLPLPTSFLNKEDPSATGISLLAPHERPGFISEGAGGRGGLDAHIPIEKEEEKGCKCVVQ